MGNYENIIEQIQQATKIGKKAAERLFNRLVLDNSNIDILQEALIDIKDNCSQCPNCFTLMYKEKCYYCNNQLRDHTILCIVKSPTDVFAFEKEKIFNGIYHVLNGEINVKKGKTPDKLTINELEHRINDKIIKEVIIAVSSTFEGEVTAHYIRTILQKYDIKITRLAKGIPMGGNLDYMDNETLLAALKNRSDFR